MCGALHNAHLPVTRIRRTPVSVANDVKKSLSFGKKLACSIARRRAPFSINHLMASIWVVGVGVGVDDDMVMRVCGC